MRVGRAALLGWLCLTPPLLSAQTPLLPVIPPSDPGRGEPLFPTSPVESCPPGLADPCACAPATADQEWFWIRGEAVAFMFVPARSVQIVRKLLDRFDPDQLITETKSLLQGESPLGDDRSGFRISGGAWLDEARTLALEAGYTRLQRGPTTLTFNADNKSVPVEFSRTIVVPVAIGRFQRIFYIPISVSNAVTGNVRFEVGEKEYQDFELAGRMRLDQDENSRLDALLGYRRFTYDDVARVETNVGTVMPGFLPGTRITTLDLVQSQSTYDGAVLGLDWEYRTELWRFNVRPKASVLYARSTVTRGAVTNATFTDGSRLRLLEGSYTTPADLGVFSSSEWTVTPELDLQISRSLGRNLRVFAGLSLLYFPDLVRSSNQFSLGVVGSRAVAGFRGDSPPPKVLPVRNAVWLSTYDLGLEFRF